MQLGYLLLIYRIQPLVAEALGKYSGNALKLFRSDVPGHSDHVVAGNTRVGNYHHQSLALGHRHQLNVLQLYGIDVGRKHKGGIFGHV